MPLRGLSLPNRIFGTVKSFATKGTLLNRETLTMLAESRDLDELVIRLKNTRYVDTLAKLQKPYTAVAVEGALKEDLVNFHSSLANIAEGSELINAYFIRYVVWNLKLVLKAKALAKQYEEIVPYVNMRAEELLGRRDVIVKALVAKDLDESVASLAGSEFAEDAQSAVNVYKEVRDIQVFDTYLDHTFYRMLARALMAHWRDTDVKSIVIPEVDAYNVLSILRAKLWSLDPEQIKRLIVSKAPSIDLYRPGGSILPLNPVRLPTVTQENIQRMISAESIRDAISELTNTVYRNVVPEYKGDIDTIAALEQNFEALLYKKYLLTFNSMFKHATMIAALKLKALEVRNLTSIATGVEQKIPADVIMKRLFTPYLA
jgi:V/A-type H+-transporting ATPase subunit C